VLEGESTHDVMDVVVVGVEVGVVVDVVVFV
jgi:hypothetical protein